MFSTTPLLPQHPFHGVSLLKQRWQWRCEDITEVMDLCRYCDVEEPLARILVGRGVTAEEAHPFLQPTLRHFLPDPFILKDMDKAVARIVRAIEAGEKIVIFGDYDVDGATSTALLLRYFAMLGVQAGFYIPDRFKEGYGPNAEALCRLKVEGAGLVITVDCGAVSFAPLQAAHDVGLDVVVIDHHKGAAELPKAVAVVNPNRLDETSAHTHLAAVGVCFLLVVALNKTLREQGFFTMRGMAEPSLLSLLDVVALGTVCDVVSLTTLNRAYVVQGLKVMQQRSNAGIAALLEVAGIEDASLTAYHLGFVLGPRINAGGRVGESDLGVRLLTEQDPDTLRDIATRLNHYNMERQAIEQTTQDAAMEAAHAQHNHEVLMVAGEGWHAGVIGIVASRLKDRFHRPSIVASLEGGKGKASARSVSGVDIGAAIVAAREHGIITEGGGHAMAGGFSFEAQRLDEVHQFFNAQMAQGVGEYLETRCLKLDIPITAAMATPALIALLDQAAPYGMGNPSPMMVLKDAKVVRVDVLKEQHIRLTITDATRYQLKAMCFRAVGTPLGDVLQRAYGKNLHIAGTLSLNHWQGNTSVTMSVVDAMEVN